MRLRDNPTVEVSRTLSCSPEKEGRIIEYRIGEWRAGMEANLDGLARRTA